MQSKDERKMKSAQHPHCEVAMHDSQLLDDTTSMKDNGKYRTALLQLGPCGIRM